MCEGSGPACVASSLLGANQATESRDAACVMGTLHAFSFGVEDRQGSIYIFQCTTFKKDVLVGTRTKGSQ